MARTTATEPAVYDRSGTTTPDRNRTGALIALLLGGLVLLALILWWVFGAAGT